jgi:sulfur carrier protein
MILSGCKRRGVGDGMAEAVIKIRVNGEDATTAARTLEDLLVASGFGVLRVATAVNGYFVPAAERARTMLEAGDKIEIVAPRQGG